MVPIAPWLRALNAVGTVAQATRAFRGMRESAKSADAAAAPDASDLERGLANVVVAALKEAFDRDRARFEVEREESGTRSGPRPSRPWRADRLRQAGAQTLIQIRLLAVLGVVVWVASVIAAGFSSPLTLGAKWLLGGGWLALSGAMASAFIAHQRFTAWLAMDPTPPDPSSPSSPPGLPDIPAHTSASLARARWLRPDRGERPRRDLVPSPS